MKTRSLASLFLVLVAGCLFAAPAVATPLLRPGGFRLPASHGYSIHVLAFDGDSHGERDGMIVLVSRKGSSVTYSGFKNVSVTETTISADLGSLGSIDLHFVPSGETRSESSACNPKPIEFESGFYEGRIDFEGEEGYAVAHATRARAEIRLEASIICGGSLNEGLGGHSPGARLIARRDWEGGKVEFEAAKNSPTRPSRFRASIEEQHGSLLIAREVKTEAGAGAFDFDVPAHTALVKPPAPFNGSARFIRHGEGPGRLRGSLSVDFPGRSNVSLGSSRSGLVRYVQNPSHPFRVR
ncbi:MAG: hypothetical protein ACTHLH_04315 [Solirubrobacterales bacterium]